MLLHWDSVLSITVQTFTMFIGSVLAPPQHLQLAFNDLHVPPWWPFFGESNSVCPYILLQTTTPGQKTSDQHSSSSEEVFSLISLITENPTSLPGIVACAINLFHFSKTSAFWCLGLWPHINPLQDKTTLNYQGNKCNLPDLPSSYWTPSTKNPWWMNSGLMFSVLPQQEKTEQPLRQLLFKRTITVESHMACQSYYRPSVLLSFLSKVITNLYSTTGTLYKFSSKRLLGGGEVEIFR